MASIISQGESAEQTVDVSVVCLNNVSLVQLLSRQYTWNPASVVDQSKIRYYYS